MKRQRLLRAMSLADEKYVNEADPRGKVKKRTAMKVWGCIAACFCCVLIGLNLWLFIPFDNSTPDVSEYSDSQYYDIIVKLNGITYLGSSYKNNFEKYFGGIFKGASAEDANLEMGTASSADGESYMEVTDNQVAGVIEGDLIKRSDRYIYYLNGTVLEVYSIAGENSALVGSYEINGPDDVKHLYSHDMEIYLSEDCSTVTAVYSYYSQSKRAYLALESLDVTSPESITLKNRTVITGSYLSSRLVDGEILLLTQFRVGYNPDFSNESNFIPQINTGEGLKSIPVGDIVYPESLSSAGYTVICKLDAKTLSLIDSSAFLSYSEEVYVSSDYAYVTRSYNDEAEMEEYTVRTSMTEIFCLGYTGESFEHVGSVTVEGYVNDQYSMDEYDGILRVVTTTNVDKYKQSKNKSVSDDILLVETATGDTNANLYCIDFSDKSVVAQVTAFAPAKEVVQSVRFDGTAAYVCTSVQLTDPVFFFDLSDLNNITVKDTGTIEGFSTSLINMGNGYLLGIGVGTNSGTLKIEVYEETEDGVESVCKYELDDTHYSTDYKSYYVDRDNGLIGLGVTRYYYNSNDHYSGQSERYILLHFNGYRLTSLLDVPLNGSNDSKRGVYIDGYMYMLGSNGLTVRPVE